MKTVSLNARSKMTFLGFLIVMMPFSMHAQKIDFLKSSFVPAAEGYVKVRTDHNNNNVIRIRISNLAEIDKLDPAKQTYIVWLVTDRETIENIGRINSSNKLKVSFKAVSSYQPIKIFISAEVNESAQVPSADIVLTTDSFWE